jgi:hypothetical protein
VTQAPFGDPDASTISYGELSAFSQSRLLLLRDVTLPLPALPSGSRMLGGRVEFPHPNAMLDVDYVNGIGLGGTNGQSGGHGMVVIHAYTGWQTATAAKTSFFYRSVELTAAAP